MSATDHPLKQLVTAFIFDFARWLLQADILEVTSRNVELHPPSDPIMSDQIFVVKLADGRTVILHIEFQGKQTHRPMQLRLLDYMSRIILTYPDAMLLSVVLYVGKGAGKDDSGEYRVVQPDGKSCLEWRYEVVRLWDIDAETLLAMDMPSLLPLVGQMRIQQPEVTFPQVVERLHAVEDDEERWRLMTAFVALIDDRKKLEMIETLVESDELLLDTPFLQRIREQASKKALEEGIEKGIEQGIEKGIEQGIERGSILTLRKMTLDALVERFNPLSKVYLELQKRIATIDDEQTLHSLFIQMLHATSVEEFQQAVEQAVEAQEA